MLRRQADPWEGDGSPARGFTAVELVVVLAIVGIVAAVAIPALSRTLRRSQFRSAAREIQTSLLAARMRAVRRNLPASVLVVPASASAPSHVLQTIEADTPAPTPTPQPSAQHAISSGSLVFLTLPASNKITFDGNGRRIAPAGAAAADIVVEGPTGAGDRNQITIRTSPTGRVEVVTPAVWQ
ncbi:MAG: GspH/FimT family pseudopilin [Acidobacteria bacterium]|nr:GspH/FimT family pseudopilin [Acidobacteriota bacterium]MCA1609887.1 GspH/FimT family pseudopilin [Acidobacteriota bacterium]